MNQDFAKALSIVIPVYNEDKNIEAAVRALQQKITLPYELIIVYDFDEDSTLPTARRLAGEFPNLRVVKNSVARGPSGAIRTGLAEAKNPITAVVMADLCDDFSQIPKMAELIAQKVDIVCPSRYCPGGRQHVEASFLKRWAPRVAGFFLKHIAGMGTYDPTNSFKIYSTSMLKNIPLSSTCSFSVTLEIVAKAHCLGYKIVELPTEWKDRVAGKSNFKLGRSLVMYMPWFWLALIGNPSLPLPRSLFSALGRPKSS